MNGTNAEAYQYNIN